MCFPLRWRRWLLLCFLFWAPRVVLLYKVECCRPSVDIFKCVATAVTQVPSLYVRSADLCREANTPTTEDNAKLNGVPKDVDRDPNVKFIFVNNSDLSNFLKPDVFLFPKQSSSLEHLSLRNCQIKELDVDTFTGLTTLKVLHLGENQFKDLPLGIFSSLANLDQLWLNVNNITRFDVRHFLPMTSLKMLCLSSNVLERLESFPASLVHLEELNLEHNKINELDSKLLYNLTHLKIINLSHNKLKALDENFFAYNIALHSVNLKNNALRSLPRGTFQHLCDLSWLDIRNNELTTPYFEWFANVVYRSKFFGSRTNFDPVTSGNQWKCDCKAGPYVDFIVKICYDTEYREIGLMKYLNIKCNTGKKIVQSDKATCGHELVYCKGVETQSKKTNSSCQSKPMCRFLPETCGGNIPIQTLPKIRKSHLNDHAPAQQNQKPFHPIMVIGAVLALIILVGFAYFVRNKHTHGRKQSESSVSTEEWETDSVLSEMKGYDNDHPPPRPPKPIGLRSLPVDASRRSSSSSFEDIVLYDAVANSTESLFPRNVGNRGGTSSTIRQNTFSEFDSTLDEDYVPMRPQFVEEVSEEIFEEHNQHIPENSSETYSSPPSDKYETISNTCGGYQVPMLLCSTSGDVAR